MNGIWPNNEMSAHTCEGKFQYCYLHFLGNDNNHEQISTSSNNLTCFVCKNFCGKTNDAKSKEISFFLKT